MRTSLFCALQGALGIAAHESLAYFKPDHSKGDCRSLDGCGKAGKGHWVPDPTTFVFPQNDYKPGHCWDLCLGKHSCAPHEALTKVCFDFQDNGFVFNFKEIDHYKYEDVAVYIERAKPPGEDSFKYSKDSDHCKALDGYKKVKCHIPYFSLTDGGSYKEMCPVKGDGGWRFFIKIKATVRHGYKKYELRSRSPDSEKYFTLSYTCSECCKGHKKEKLDLISASSRDGEREHEKHHRYNDDEERRGRNRESDDEEYLYAESPQILTCILTNLLGAVTSTVRMRLTPTGSTVTVTSMMSTTSTSMSTRNITSISMLTSTKRSISTSTRRSIIMNIITSTITSMATVTLTPTVTSMDTTTAISMDILSITVTTMGIITDIIMVTSMATTMLSITATITGIITGIITVTSMVIIMGTTMGISMDTITSNTTGISMDITMDIIMATITDTFTMSIMAIITDIITDTITAISTMSITVITTDTITAISTATTLIVSMIAASTDITTMDSTTMALITMA
ncbi:hypothetical protein FDECE_13330 [Fusarium decemcellulare]|nr:hypothetical protein FDECE_13330 [Fusarium decemcellulare]